jgi:hypothetical protein
MLRLTGCSAPSVARQERGFTFGVRTVPTVLIVCASPLDQDRLRLGSEEKQIRQALQRSRNREQWRIESNQAVTVDDLRRALLDHRPTVVHFSGHGGNDGLCFETVDGMSHSADMTPLAKLLHIFRADLRCVVLNACYSKPQAELIREEIDYVIGMSKSIDDDSAAKFAVAFYDAVFAGTDFRTAFDLGCTTLDLNNLPDSEVPSFLTSPRLEHTTLLYNAHVPEVERVVHAYLNTPFTERATLTTTGEPLTRTLREFYGERMQPPIDRVRVLSMQHVEGDNWKALVDLRAGRHRDRHTYYLQIRNRQILIEWEATVGLWSVPPKTYLALGSTEPVVARVKAELSSSYYGFFGDNVRHWQSVRLVSADSESLRGYVQKGTQQYRELIELLVDGHEHSVTIEIANLTGDPSESVIKRLLSKNWLYRPTAT